MIYIFYVLGLIYLKIIKNSYTNSSKLKNSLKFERIKIMNE